MQIHETPTPAESSGYRPTRPDTIDEVRRFRYSYIVLASFSWVCPRWPQPSRRRPPTRRTGYAGLPARQPDRSRTGDVTPRSERHHHHDAGADAGAAQRHDSRRRVQVPARLDAYRLSPWMRQSNGRLLQLRTTFADGQASTEGTAPGATGVGRAHGRSEDTHSRQRRLRLVHRARAPSRRELRGGRRIQRLRRAAGRGHRPRQSHPLASGCRSGRASSTCAASSWSTSTPQERSRPISRSETTAGSSESTSRPIRWTSCARMSRHPHPARRSIRTRATKRSPSRLPASTLARR